VFAPAAYADGFAAIASGDYRQALTRFRAAVARDPLLVDRASRSPQMSLGIARLRAGLMPEAIAPLEAAVSMFPDSSEARRILGTAYAATGEGDKAVDQLQRAALLAPRDERTRLALARVLRDTGRLDAATESLRAVLIAIPRSAEARWMLGDVMEKTGRILDAARELEAAGAAVIAGKVPLYWRVAGIYDRHQEFARVVELLRARARIAPNDPAVHRQLGLVLHRLGSNDHGFAELVMADLLGGADAESLTAIGQIHLAADRLQDAESAARRAITMQADHSEAHYVLGRALLRQGRTADARDTLEVFQRLRGLAMEDQRRKYEEQVKELLKVSPQ
jgi:tetratricopeptide (TPR) repeat protein